MLYMYVNNVQKLVNNLYCDVLHSYYGRCFMQLESDSLAEV